MGKNKTCEKKENKKKMVTARRTFVLHSEICQLRTRWCTRTHTQLPLNITRRNCFTSPEWLSFDIEVPHAQNSIWGPLARQCRDNLSGVFQSNVESTQFRFLVYSNLDGANHTQPPCQPSTIQKDLINNVLMKPFDNKGETTITAQDYDHRFAVRCLFVDLLSLLSFVSIAFIHKLLTNRESEANLSFALFIRTLSSIVITTTDRFLIGHTKVSAPHTSSSFHLLLCVFLV